MLITKLKVDYFGKFSGKVIELEPGINLLYGENEAGKSTLHAFIKGMFFGIERLRGRGSGSKEDAYTRYLPWDYPGAYGGQMDIEIGDRSYRLQRSFHSNDKSFTILDLTSGREVTLREGHISELIPRLTEATYRNTISIEQLRAETDAELASHVKNYITNLSIAKSREVNVEKTLGSLKEQRKALESSSYADQLSSLAKKIAEGEDKEKKIDQLTLSLKELKSKEADLKEKAERHKCPKNQRLDELIAQLPAILEKYKNYKELTRQHSQLNSQKEVLGDRLVQCQKYIEEQDKQREGIKGLGKRSLIYIALSLVIGLLSFAVTKSLITTVWVLVLVLFLGVMLLTFSIKKEQNIVKKEYFNAEMSMKHYKEQLEELSNRRNILEDEFDELHDIIMLYMQEFISEDELTPQAMERLQDTIRGKKREAEEVQDERNRKLQEYSFQIGTISMELSQLEENEAELIRNKEQYKYIMQKQMENKLELDAINLALTTIEEISTTIHDNFGMQLNEAVSKIVGEVTNHKYKDIKIDDKLNIKLGWNDNYIILDRLSAGTIDQVYFALRLAVSDLLLGKEPMPLILDDSFALYDDSRVKAALTWLADRNQVLVFSCQLREKHLLKELGIPFNFIKL